MINHIDIDWNSIEKKWRERWEIQKIFEADPDVMRQKYFITVAYPYPNSPQHLGHGRTYTVADAHARYMRMKGHNVLFPMGFHYTGTPILGMSRRVAAGDQELLDTFRKIYFLSEETISSFVDPLKIASYFHNEIKIGMKEMGYSIDWRREFTTIDKLYSKYVSWQFRLLRKKGLIIQGSHPVGWCPRDQNPVSQHDTIGDVEPDFNEYVLIKFKLDNYTIPTATLRPETVYGVTNIWINPKIDYVKIDLDDNGEKWIVSRQAAKKLEFLDHKVIIKSPISIKELVGKYVKNTITNDMVPVYPASFVDADSGTGVVMSVPAHAPFDYQALKDLKQSVDLQKEFGLTIEIEPVVIIDSEEIFHSDTIPAEQFIKKFKINSQNDPDLQKATNELYSHEFYKGKMSKETGSIAGLSVAKAKDKVKTEITTADPTNSIMFELVNKPVRCRCGNECVIKILKDQWFLNYGDIKWKSLAHKCINKMDIVPEEIRQEFNYVFDWLKERACARKSGLGTKLPWDQDWIIESLSDSVIYMAYYILAKYVNNGSIINPDKIDDTFFDYVLHGNGQADKVSTECDISKSLLEQLRNEFSYFYPVDSRHSGRDLIPNHLSFFIFNHVALFEEEEWPRQIVVNGSVLMEGKKMSKSIGNIIPLRQAIKEYSADAIRLSILISAELLQDSDFSYDAIKSVRSKLQDIYETGLKYAHTDHNFLSHNKRDIQSEDRWLISKLQRIIEDTTTSMDKLRMREALHNILYLLDQNLQWHSKRVRAKNRESLVVDILNEFNKTRLRLLAPFAPFTAEEVWERMGNSESIIFAGWPLSDEGKKDIMAEESEELIMSMISDLQSIIKTTKMIPKRIILYIAAPWKSDLYLKILSIVLVENKFRIKDIIKELMKDSEQISTVRNDSNLIKKTIEDILSNPIIVRKRRLKTMSNFDERPYLEDAKSFISMECNSSHAQIDIYSEEDMQKYDPKSRARFARAFKPAIYIE
jgi:leucyl-tRNA synthetase